MVNKLSYGDKSLYDHLKDLFPICRSITGDGINLSLSYFEKYHKEYQRLEFKTGEKVFDWVIPLEWNIKDAYIENVNTKERFAEFKKNNLHIVGYSIPKNAILNLDELSGRIHTHKDNKYLIPYVTSYYKEYWGFCMSKKEKDSMKKGLYKVYINSTLKKGKLDLSHAIIKGNTSKEILFSSYLCHPSMANNELSGPVVLNAILNYIKTNYKITKYTYRFIMQPETIGSIAYLSKFKDDLINKVICGFNLSCVGDERAYSYVSSPYENTLADKAIFSAISKFKNFKKYSYLERGSDERQYCSPRIQLPLVTFSRSKFGEYPEYHSDADNLNLVTNKGLNESLDVLKTIVDAFEEGLYPKLLTYGEPQLGRRGIYPNLSKSGKTNSVKLRMDFLAYCDGKTNIFDICKIINSDLYSVLKEYKFLKKYHILE